jgi:hypothetical protein
LPEPLNGPDEEACPGVALVLDGFVAGLPPEEDEEEDDDAEEVSPAPAAEVLLPPELREAHPAKAASTTAVVATVFTRDFIVLHLLAESVTGIWTQRSTQRFPSISLIFRPATGSESAGELLVAHSCGRDGASP